MRLKTTLCLISIGLAMLGAPAAFADGGCSASEKKEAGGALKKAEDAEKAGA